VEQRVFTDHRCLDHRVPFGFPETPERLEGILRRLGRQWKISEGGQHPQREEAIGEVHEPTYVDAFRRAVERGDGLLGSGDNPLSSGTWRAAGAAIDATLAAADWVMGGSGREAFAAVRPPGHHAERNLAMGFCYFNNAAVAVERFTGHYGLERVAVFDFDVHHGNGTQNIFGERGDVLYVSTHQWPFYPGTGSAAETGRGPGEGTTLNLPLAQGAGDEEYLEIVRTRVLPAIRLYAPQVLVVSAGFDSWRGDPLGGMRVSERSFADWGRLLREVAEELCQGRMLAALEGGYDLASLPRLVATYLAGRVET
jgi:acetoin utilization deacetylase AcuC-like enzyme